MTATPSRAGPATDPPEDPAAASERRRRSVAVSGSASGIGLAVRTRLERSGLRVAGVDLHDAEVEADLASPEGRGHAVAAVTQWSGGALDGVVACAGLGPHVRPVEAIARVNHFGALAFLDGLLPLLARGEAAAAVAISSNASTLTPAHPGLVDALLAGEEEPACRLAGSLDGATV